MSMRLLGTRALTHRSTQPIADRAAIVCSPRRGFSEDILEMLYRGAC